MKTFPAFIKMFTTKSLFKYCILWCTCNVSCYIKTHTHTHNRLAFTSGEKKSIAKVKIN